MIASKLQLDLNDEILPFNILNTKYTSHSVSHYWHAFTEIIYIVKGSVVQKINDEIYSAVGGDLIVINGLDMHSLYTKPNNFAEIFEVQIPPSVISFFYRDKKTFGINSVFYKNEHIKSNRISYFLDNLISESTEKKDAYRYFEISFLYGLIGEIIRDQEQSNTACQEAFYQRKELFDRLIPAMNYIEKNIFGDIKLCDAAKHTNMSVQYFCKCFKKATTYTFIEYVNNLRIMYAQDMLLTTEKSITEIAYHLNFSTINYFNRVFKQTTGVSPSLFRRK